MLLHLTVVKFDETTLAEELALAEVCDDLFVAVDDHLSEHAFVGHSVDLFVDDGPYTALGLGPLEEFSYSLLLRQVGNVSLLSLCGDEVTLSDDVDVVVLEAFCEKDLPARRLYHTHVLDQILDLLLEPVREKGDRKHKSYFLVKLGWHCRLQIT